MPRYHIWTVGCQMNVADSAKLGAGLDRLGYEAVEDEAQADVVIINTCAVRQSAEERAISKLGRLRRVKLRRPEMTIAMTGCMVGMRTTDLEKRFPFVDVFARPQRFDDILIALGADAGDLGGEFWPESVGEPQGPTAYVPVIEGCDKFCTYCIVPYRRGRERSRSIDEVAHEVATLVRRGVREVTLLGQTVEAYGHDLPERPDLGDLMRAIHDLPGLERIRFLTSYPPDMTDRIVAAVAELPKVCEWFSLPVQSGHDDVLTNMRRGYTVAHFLNRVEKVRSLMPAAGITTDVIVGYPGESDEHFQATYDLLERVRFDKVHVAAYSPRPGTIAWRQTVDDVPAEVKRERLHAVERLQERIAGEINATLLDSAPAVLVEGHGEKDGRAFGRTRTGKLVHFEGHAHPGDLVEVRITHTGPWSLTGQPLSTVRA
ncbi:MAG: tRNA (N6-isopentenyl adenosine(37)-C2)-methylthiotransferase MiaB [Dehalococcoidia bacterium]